MEKQISHNINEESIEAKTRWFKSLSIEERMQNLCDFTELALSINPTVGDKKSVKSVTGRIQILSKT